jgi:hypothetical protein
LSQPLDSSQEATLAEDTTEVASQLTLRIEWTVLDPKLFRERAEWPTERRSRLLFCSRYEEAVNPPFPAEGKKGLSVWVGPLSAFKEPKARLLWELEKRRKRPTVVVLTAQKGRSFMRALRELASLLGDTYIAPLSLMRRRGANQWDSLDFFSAGDSAYMEGANPRLKRLKQAGWETLVDRLGLLDGELKREYFDSLTVSREKLLAATAAQLRARKLSAVIGVAGECLTRDSLYGLLDDPLLAGILDQVHGQAPPPEGHWLLLGHRTGANEVLLYGHSVEPLREGEIVHSQSSGAGRPSELAVAEVKQQLQPAGMTDSAEQFCWARVDWRYPPEREIPTLWKQKSASSAGSNPAHG